MIEILANRLFADARRAGELEFMEGRTLAIRVLDLDRQWVFRGEAGCIRVFPQEHGADAIISGNVKEFILLASRREDPDTLFFHRRLNIEGDTELGLAVKNFLDGLDPAALPKGLEWLLDRAGYWVESNLSAD